MYLEDLGIMNWTTNFGFDDDEDLQPKKHKEPSRAKKPKLDATKIDSMCLDPSFTFKAPRTAKKESQVSWSDTYEPKSVTDLVIHHNKVEDLEAALKSCEGNIVLLTGPSGSGKTVSLKCICKKLNIGIKEWITSVTKTIEYDSLEFNDPSLYCNAIQEFEHFLLRSNKPRVTCSYSSDIVLIKDLPNVFYNDATLLHETLNKFASNMKCKLVFILNDEQLIYKLFPNSIIIQFKVNQIKFNPINDTGLIRTLQNILGKEKIDARNDTIINIIQNCNGNLAYAINQLYFTTVMKEKITGKQSKLTVKMLKDSKSSGNKSLDKNKQISYFQLIGRVLYPKREPVLPSEFYQLKNPSLDYKQKDLFKFKHSPMDLVQEFITQPSSTVDVLQENYVSKFTNIKDMLDSAVMFSTVDQYMNYSSNNNLMNTELYLQLMVTSLMKNEHVLTSYAPVQRSHKHLLPDRNETNKLVQELFADMFPHESSLNIVYDILSIVKQTRNLMNLEFHMNQVKFVHDFTFK